MEGEIAMLDPARSTTTELPPVPLVVDLDGTLIQPDLLIETFFGELCRRPPAILDLLPAFLAGKAAFKQRLAAKASLDVANLPYDETVLALIRQARADGRRVYFASASNEMLVPDVARHVGLFGGWFGSSATTNLKSAAKADLLVEAFGYVAKFFLDKHFNFRPVMT
jgi:hypothetical protein